MKKPQLKKPKLGKPTSIHSGLKAPKFASDLYADLRDRRLLPLIACLVVAIVAVPFLLKDGAADEPASPGSPVTGGTGSTPAAATFSVVPAREELRDYRKRLAHRKPGNPFSPYAANRVPKAEKEEVEAVVESAEGTGGETAPTGESAPPATTEAAPSQPPVVKATVKAEVGYGAVVKTEFVGSEPKEQQIEAQAKLPNEANPAIVYTGISPDKSGALFLMTSNVTAFYGHGQCVLGGATCQQLKLKVGKSATFAIGYGETRYKVTLVDLVPIVEEARVEGDG